MNTASPETYIQKDVLEAADLQPKVSLLLVHIPSRHYRSSFSEPVGVQQLAGTLIDRRMSVAVSLGLLREPGEDLDLVVESVKARGFTHVGFSMPLGSLEDGISLLEKMSVLNQEKQAAGKLPVSVLLGGNLPTSIPEEYLVDLVNRFPFAVAVRGWGDKPIFQLMQRAIGNEGIQLGDISGLVFHTGQEVQVNPLLPDDPNFIAGKPVRLLTDPTMVANVEASQNCSHPFCTFCARFPIMKGLKEVWTPKPLEQVIGQIADFSVLGIREGTFTDEEALGTTAEHAINHGGALAEAIISAKKAGKIDAGFTFAFSTRSDSIVALVDSGRTDVLVRLHEAGLSRIFLGVESGVSHDFQRWDNLSILPQGKRYGKGIRVEDHTRAINTLSAVGIGIEMGFIPFDPLLDLGEIDANARFLLDNGLARHASRVFNPMRLQSGARYEMLVGATVDRLVRTGKLKEKPEILGKFNPSTLLREYAFLHPLVGRMVDAFLAVELENRPREFILKRYYRSHLITGEPTEGSAFDTLAKLREQELQLMLAGVGWADWKMRNLGLERSQYDQLTPYFDDDQISEITGGYKLVRHGIWDRFLETEMPDYLRKALLDSNIPATSLL